MKYGYVYQRSGGPLLSWRSGPPNQARGADARSLGGYGDGGPIKGGLGSLSGPTVALPLPRPGAPEPVGGCGCGMGDDVVIDIVSPSFIAGCALGYFVLSKIFKGSSGG